MTFSGHTRRVLTTVGGTAALLCASQALLVALYKASGLFRGFRWDPAGDASMPPVIPSALYPWATWCAFLFSAAVFPLAWEVLVGKHSFSRIGFRPPEKPLRDGALAVLGAAGFLACMALAFQMLGRTLPHELAWGNILFFSLQWGVTAVGEETLYRGVLQRRLSGAVGLLPGILVASLVWAVVGHMRAPALENLAVRFPAGLLLGYLYAKSKSLYPAILAHWLLDMAVTSGI